MKNYWLKKERAKILFERAEILAFFGELRWMVDGLDDEQIQGMDFKSLYTKYPRVRIGIRRALIVARKQCLESN